MEIGFGLAAVALAALAALTASSGPGRLLRALLRRGLPGACPGTPEGADERQARLPEAPARLRWTEVVNLTAADLASPPRGRAESSPAAERATAATR